MLKDAYCILCLKNDRRNINIYATELQYVYENLADFKVEAEGCWVCYVCHARLHQCQRLKQLAVSTRGLLNSCETKFEDKFGEFDTSLALCRSTIKYVSSLPADDIKLELDDIKKEPTHDGVGRDDEPDKASNCKSREHTIKEELVCNLSPSDLIQRNDTRNHTINYTIQKQRKLIKKTKMKLFRIRLNRTPFSCDVCGKNFRDKSSFERHYRIHTGDKPYICDVCSRRFTLKSNLKAHVIRIHKGEKPYTCDVCSKTFALKSYLQRHYGHHTEDKPYSCDVCSKKFTQRSVLKAHIKTHTGEKPYSCDVCSKKYTKRSSLQVHVRIHMGNKPFVCDVCAKKFTRQICLQNHIRIHTGDKPYTCDVCAKNFIQLSNLKAHARIHTGDKPYSCDVCSKTFARIGYLRKHFNKIHKDEKAHLQP